MNESIQSLLERWPTLYLELLKVKRRGHWSRDWIVSRKTDVCIEGFPRSANSFAHSAFNFSQDVKLRTATHTHSPAQVVKAVELGIPTMVCMRKPIDAVCGLLAFGRQLAQKDGHTYDLPTKPEIDRTISRWLFFHRMILPYAKLVFIAEFGSIISDYQQVSREFINRFDLPYSPYDPEKLPKEQLFNKSFHIGPDKKREQIKGEIMDALRNSVYSEEFGLCNRIYRALIANSRE